MSRFFISAIVAAFLLAACNNDQPKDPLPPLEKEHEKEQGHDEKDHEQRNGHKDKHYGKKHGHDKKNHKKERDHDEKEHDYDEKVYPFSALRIPKGHLPPPGECKIWIPGRPPGQQGPPQSCSAALRNAPPGAWVISHSGGRYKVNVCSKTKPGVISEVRWYRE